MNRTVEPTEDGERLDRFVASIGELSRSQAKALIEAGAVTIDGGVIDRPSHRVRSGDGVIAEMPDGPPPPVLADPSIAFDVVHEDDEVIVVDKPAGLVVHPGAGRTGGTLADGLLARFPELAGVGPAHRPGIVHRLDRGTSGLLIVARSGSAHEHLTSALAAHDITREYEALVWGAMGAARGIVDAPIGRSRRDPTKRAIAEDGRDARTHYEVDVRYEHPDPASLLTCRLETGRTHQIRVHLSAIGHPVAGDGAYGGARADIGLDRPFLHAKRLVFEHPRTGESIVITSPRPVALVDALSKLS